MVEVVQEIDFETEAIARQVVDTCYTVHKQMGPGLLERVYEACLCHELRKREIAFEQQKSVPLYYKGEALNIDHRLDLVIDNKVILEIKSVERQNELFKAQLLSYLRLSGMRLGILANFNSNLMKNGIERVVL